MATAAERPPTVAVDVRALLSGPHGIATYTEELLAELARRGRVRLVAVAHRRPPELPPGVELALQRAPSGVLWQQLALPLWLARTRPAAFWSPLQTLPLLAFGPRLITTVHDLTVLTHPTAHTAKVRWSQLPFLRPSLARAARIVAISEATATQVAERYPRTRGRIRVIGNGVGADFVPGSAVAVAATRLRLGAPEGFVLAVGTLEPRKNLGLLLDAWEQLRMRNAAPPLLLAGPSGWGEQRLRERLGRLAELGVRQLGVLPRAELVEVMQAASIFVYPSLAEGFGLPPAEAMACGVPVIAADATSLPEVVADAGLLVDPRDVDALREALARVLEDPALAARLAAAGPVRAARFTWQRAAADLEQVFLEALAPTRE